MPESTKDPDHSSEIKALSDALERNSLSDSQLSSLVRLGEQARAKVGRSLYLASSTPTPEKRKQLDITNGYNWSLDILMQAGFILANREARKGCPVLPSLEEIKAAFSAEKILFAKGFADPRIVIYPVMPFQQQIESVSKSGLGLGSIYADSKLYESGDNISGWLASIIDAEPIEDNTDGNSLNKRLQNRKAANRPIEAGMTKAKALMLMLQLLKSGDKRTSTLLLDGESSTESTTSDGRKTRNQDIPFGFCNLSSRQICFNSLQLGGSVESARFHSSVDADLKK